MELSVKIGTTLEAWAQDAKRKSNEAESKVRSKVRGAEDADGE